MKYLVGLILFSLAGSVSAVPPDERPVFGEYGRENQRCPKKICLFFDGTCNDPDSDTNVLRLFEIISAPRSPEVLCYYDIGVGANINMVSGAVGGYGFSRNVLQAYQFVAESYRIGDKIYMFGFSRGARQAQVLCDIFDQVGVPSKPMQRQGEKDHRSLKISNWTRRIVGDYKDANRDGIVAARPAGFQRVPVEFVGIWDCVESLGSNAIKQAMSGSKNVDYVPHKFYNYHFPSNIKRAYHAMAMDEQRSFYQPIRWLGGHQPHQELQQVWFPGGHGDVGGGYKRTQAIAGISLNWILSKLSGDEILPVSNYRVHEDTLGPISDTTTFGISKPLEGLSQNYPRSEHFWTDGLHSMTKPMVHRSVISRMRASRLPEPVDRLEVHKVYRPRQFAVAARVFDLPSPFYQIRRDRYGQQPSATTGANKEILFYGGIDVKDHETADFARIEEAVNIVD